MYKTIIAAVLMAFGIVNVSQAQPISAPCTGWCALFVPFTGDQMIVLNKDWSNLGDATTYVRGKTVEALFANPTTDKHLMIITFENRTYWTHLTTNELCGFSWGKSDIVPLLTGVTCK